MNRNHHHQHNHRNNNHHNNSRSSNNSDGITQSDAISPRFRSDLIGDLATNYCYSCKSEFLARNIHDIMEHYSKPHSSDLKCLYCKTGNVHQYKCEQKGVVQYYHDCYRSKMGYDK